ncbi:hypothetical protein H8B02_19045 [Bradyrhizobium sp. Pear77]|uniref:hypothetical protein n=1 Tax=Bradyrhizobium TaxID=374 RepID=UPI001E570A89|nr:MULTISPECIES: hypothetical protein [Bradyrhizobium]MCC8955449.1 hypothetical protein [Bradyrhizobium altum]MCC8965233.1 hypothetical protein [Bradyrhizobium oropedii]
MVSQSGYIGGPWGFKKLLNRLRASLSRTAELAYLSAHDIDAIAREVNLSTSDFRRMAQSPGSPELLSKRLALAGLSENALAACHGDVLRDLQRVCGLCQSKTRCAADVERRQSVNPLKGCPNEQTLRALAREIGDSHNVFAIDRAQSFRRRKM